MAAKISLVGILNITPDSFSDGGQFYNAPDLVLTSALKLIEDGAELVDIGADSTRPGSICVGKNEEWYRLEPVLKVLSKNSIPFSVDTHHALIAERAIESGAIMINDVTAGVDPDMFPLISRSKIKYVAMYSRCSAPHVFAIEPEGDILSRITDFFKNLLVKFETSGVERSKIILDPGMGKFISDDPLSSWQVIRGLSAFEEFNLPLYLGCSRKGFLQLPFERDISERDYLSSISALIASKSIGNIKQLYIRTHNIRLQKLVLNLS